MLDASAFSYQHFIDSRTRTNKGFKEGFSGPLKLATDPSSRKKYIIKYACQHNAANEYTACWLADKIGAPAPHAHLMYPDSRLNALYPVAIEFIEGFTTFDKAAVPESMQDDLMAQFALNAVIGTDDRLQLNSANGHIYSYDFSEAFCISDNLLLKMVVTIQHPHCSEHFVFFAVGGQSGFTACPPPGTAQIRQISKLI
jgi:hypothetical protein